MDYCPSCGHQIQQDDVKFCPQCGIQLQRAEMPRTNAAPAGPLPPAPSIKPETSGMAIGSLICGIFFFFFPSAAAAVVLGHMSRSDIRRSGGRKTGAGMALVGLVLGYVGISIVPILIIAAIAIPNLLRAKMTANEVSAANSLQTLNASLVLYSATYGTLPSSLLDLQPSSSPSSEAAGLIDPLLATGRREGYEFDYQTSEMAEGDSKDRGYIITAKPVIPGTTGTRFFFTDQTAVIRAETNRVATADSPPIM